MPEEAPEGIVAYSWSGAIPVSSGFNPQPLLTQNQLITLLNNSGVILVGQNAFIDLADTLGDKFKNTEKLILSNSFVQTLDLVCEGPIEGPISGEYIYSGNAGQTGWNIAQFSGFSVPSGYESSRWLRSIYWNQIPVLSDQAQFNFQNVQSSYAIGTANGTNLQNLISQETTSRILGERLRGPSSGVSPKIYRILNPNCRGVIVNVKIPALSNTNPVNGNIKRGQINWQIQYRPIFSNIQNQTDFSNPTSEVVFGKIIAAGGYVRSTTINFNTTQYLSKQTVLQNTNSPQPPTTITTDTPITIGNFLDNPSFIGWELQIIRTTADSNSSISQNATYIDSITELYGGILTYPNSAIFSSTFNAEFFTSIPDRAFECKLLKVKIPGNYDPILRTYATNGFATTNGFWDGTFSTGAYWTNNPAWCFYDLLTNTRYGLGKFIDNLNVDKFSLYKIGQYCDELVADGEGYIEPRFTCNTLIGSREEAFKVINDLASVFRGAAYYAYGSVYAVQDSLKSPRTTFTNANVENGDFIYSSSSKKTRQSIAVVRWNNPKNFYQPAIEYVEDFDSIRKYGIRELDLTAFACTSRGQAIRFGNWALLSNNTETETVQFTTSLEATALRLGDVFKVFDYNRKWKRYGGRIRNINNFLDVTNTPTGATVQLDSILDLQTGVQYTLSALTPSYYYDSAQITGLTDQNSNDIRRSFLQNFNFSGDFTFTSGNTSVVRIFGTGFDTINYVTTGYPIYTVELGPNSSNYTGSRYFIDPDFDYYRVINIKESDLNKYDIIGLQYSPQKFLQIDSGISYQRKSILGTNNVPASPYGLVLTPYDTSNSTQIIHYGFLIDNNNFINNYKVFVTTGAFPPGIPDNSFLSALLPSDVLQGIYYPPYLNLNGNYTFRVYSYNSVDSIYSSNCASGVININTDLNITNVIISSLQYVG